MRLFFILERKPNLLDKFLPAGFAHWNLSELCPPLLPAAVTNVWHHPKHKAQCIKTPLGTQIDFEFMKKPAWAKTDFLLCMCVCPSLVPGVWRRIKPFRLTVTFAITRPWRRNWTEILTKGDERAELSIRGTDPGARGRPFSPGGGLMFNCPPQLHPTSPYLDPPPTCLLSTDRQLVATVS